MIEGGDAAVDAVIADGNRRHFDLVKELKDSKWEIPPELDAAKPTTRTPKSGALEEQVDNFKALCLVYENGLQSYVPYRIQSANAHPSYAGAMAYVALDGTLSTRALSDSFAYLVDSARCAILAAKAFAPVLTGTGLDDAVVRAEAAFGVVVPLWTRVVPA